MAEFGIRPFFLLLSVSLLNSLFISHLYVRFYGVRETGSRIYRSFALLATALTAIFVCLQFSIPLSLGLLGALSIVRFRNPVKDPEEIGFILLVVASSLTCATFNFPFLVIIMAISFICLLILNSNLKFLMATPQSEGMLVVNIPCEVYQNFYGDISSNIRNIFFGAKIDSVLEESNNYTVTYRYNVFSEKQEMLLKSKLTKVSDKININFISSSGHE